MTAINDKYDNRRVHLKQFLVRGMSCTFTGVADITKNGQGAPEWIQKLYKYSLKDV